MSEHLIEKVALAIIKAEQPMRLASSAINIDNAKELARAVLSAIEESGTHAVVPRELTQQMRRAMWSAMFESRPDESAPVLLGAAHDAMLSNRPSHGVKP